MPASDALEAVARYGRFIDRPVEEVAADLQSYAGLLRQWQRVKNLVSRETLNELWPRHIIDSLQLVRCLDREDQCFLDLGSGAGFPAVPIAIARRASRDTRFALIEPNSRKASFLRTVARELALPLVVKARRAEEIDSRETIVPDVIMARALAPLSELCGLAAPFFGPSTRAIFHKGREYAQEVAESRSTWLFDLVIVPSDTGAESALLEIRNLRVRSAG